MVALKENARRRYPPWRQVRAELGLPEPRVFGDPAPVDKRDALTRSLVSRERGQHAVVVVERTADAVGVNARMQPALERLVRHRLLQPRQAAAGQRIYRLWSLGICGARDAEAGGSTVHDPGGMRDAQLQAATEYRQVRDAVGLRMWPCLFAVVCEDMSLEQFANERGAGRDRKQWMGILKVALDIAADHLGID